MATALIASLATGPPMGAALLFAQTAVSLQPRVDPDGKVTVTTSNVGDIVPNMPFGGGDADGHLLLDALGVPVAFVCSKIRKNFNI